MDQFPVAINIDNNWNSHTRIIDFFTIPHQSCFLLYKCRNGEVIFAQRCFHEDNDRFREW